MHQISTPKHNIMFLLLKSKMVFYFFVFCVQPVSIMRKKKIKIKHKIRKTCILFFGILRIIKAMETFNTYFLTALKASLKNKPHGKKARLARDAGISPSQLCDILKKRSHGSESTRRKIAMALGYQYETFLELGKQIVHDIPLADDAPVVDKAKDDYSTDERIVELIQQIISIAQHDSNELVYLETMADVTMKRLKLR